MLFRMLGPAPIRRIWGCNSSQGVLYNFMFVKQVFKQLSKYNIRFRSS